ncbi:hypothetical protein TIFTF001_019024 [Ficus carica]|uniref:Uncharacterized protein n=1 Tax=Ficus carica TaxID=3494 RepID=A0AA88ASH6_FICCA|nr:hypothetical protein TIFTF001_019024 [Ficus carica]
MIETHGSRVADLGDPRGGGGGRLSSASPDRGGWSYFGALQFGDPRSRWGGVGWGGGEGGGRGSARRDSGRRFVLRWGEVVRFRWGGSFFIRMG